MDEALARRLDALLPQTQCTRCGYADCRAYANAMAAGLAHVNRCPPGGSATLARLAQAMDAPIEPLAAECGPTLPPAAAVIDEALCIGCTLCIQACPVDAIIGAPGRMHAVMSALCSGCELCVAPCPVDCIAMAPVARGWSDQDARSARTRYLARATRLRMRSASGRAQPRSAPLAAHAGKYANSPLTTPAQRKVAIAAALARARARRRANHDDGKE